MSDIHPRRLRFHLPVSCMFALCLAMVGCSSSNEATQPDSSPAEQRQESPEVGPGTALPPEAFEPKVQPEAPPDNRTLDEKLAAAHAVLGVACVETSSLDVEGNAEPDRVGTAVETAVAIDSIQRDEDYAWFWLKAPNDADIRRGALIATSAELAMPAEVRPQAVQFRATLVGAEGLDVGSEVIVTVCEWKNP